jgi:hypothetical protein
MFLLVVVLSVHASFGRCIDQKEHGQTIQRPKETWTGNIATKRNMDRQYNNQNKHARNMDRHYNYQKKHGLFLLVVVLSVHVSFGRCIVCPCFFWSLYCLSMFLLVVQAIQRPKETWTDNTTTKRNMDRQYNDHKIHGQTIQQPNETCKKHGQAIQLPKETWTSFTSCIVCPCFFWSLYWLSMFLLVVVLSVHASFGRCIACPCFFKHRQTIQRPKETWTDNTKTKKNMDRQYSDQKKHGQTIQQPNETCKKHGQAIQLPKENCLSMFLLVVVLSVDVSFGLCIACPCFFWSLYCLSLFLLVVVLSVHVSFGLCIACPCFFW